MESGRGLRGIGRRIAFDRLARRQHLDLDAALFQLRERRRVGLHLPLRAGADDESRGQLVEDGLEVVEDQSVPLASPPIPHDALGKNDDVARLLCAVDDDAAEAVVLQACDGSILGRVAGQAHDAPRNLHETVADQRRRGVGVERGEPARPLGDEPERVRAALAEGAFEPTLLAERRVPHSP
jgi:hypothetical protein